MTDFKTLHALSDDVNRHIAYAETATTVGLRFKELRTAESRVFELYRAIVVAVEEVKREMEIRA